MYLYGCYIDAQCRTLPVLESFSRKIHGSCHSDIVLIFTFHILLPYRGSTCFYGNRPIILSNLFWYWWDQHLSACYSHNLLLRVYYYLLFMVCYNLLHLERCVRVHLRLVCCVHGLLLLLCNVWGLLMLVWYVCRLPLVFCAISLPCMGCSVYLPYRVINCWVYVIAASCCV